jgi:hypothetical protein
VKILRGKLIMRELRMRHRVRECPVHGSGTDGRAGTDRAGSADEIVAADAMRSGRIGKAVIGRTMIGHRIAGSAVAGKAMRAETVCGRCMDRAGVHTASSETGAAHAHATAAGVKAAATTSVEAATAAAMPTAATAAVSSTATTTVAGRRCAGANNDHGRPSQKREGKLALHVTPRPLECPACACREALVRNRNRRKVDAVSALASQICARLHCGIRSLKVCPQAHASSNLRGRNADHGIACNFLQAFA